MKLGHRDKTIILLLLVITSFLVMYVGFSKEYIIVQSFVKYICRECIGLEG